MPYTGPADETLPDNIKRLAEDERARWVNIFNDAFARCQKRDGDDCEAFAFKNANGVVLSNELQFTTNQTASVRRETVEGVEYLIAPVVAVKAGVLKDEYVPADEIEKFWAAWDGRPFVVGHPEENGTYTSANDPERLAALQIGHLFHTSFKDNKLKGEVWVDVNKAQQVDGGSEVVERLEEGEPLEVSTAYFRDREETPGTFEGKEYAAIARNLRPDHLAALLDAKGACSWKDGCGAPRVNENDAQELLEDKFGMETQSNEKSLMDAVREWLSPLLNALRANQEEVTAMASTSDMVKAIVADERLELNADALEGVPAKVLSALVKALKGWKTNEKEPASNEPPEEPKAEKQEQEAAQPEANEEEQEAPCANVQIEALAAKVAALEAKLNEGSEQRKVELVSALSANTACAFTEDQLNELAVNQLEALQRSLVPADYSGQGGGPRANAKFESYKMPDIHEAA